MFKSVNSDGRSLVPNWWYAYAWGYVLGLSGVHKT